MNIIQEEGHLDRTRSYFLNSDLSFQGIWNPQTKPWTHTFSGFFLKFFFFFFFFFL